MGQWKSLFTAISLVDLKIMKLYIVYNTLYIIWYYIYIIIMYICFAKISLLAEGRKIRSNELDRLTRKSRHHKSMRPSHDSVWTLCRNFLLLGLVLLADASIQSVILATKNYGYIDKYVFTFFHKNIIFKSLYLFLLFICCACLRLFNNWTYIGLPLLYKVILWYCSAMVQYLCPCYNKRTSCCRGCKVLMIFHRCVVYT